MTLLTPKQRVLLVTARHALSITGVGLHAIEADEPVIEELLAPVWNVDVDLLAACERLVLCGRRRRIGGDIGEVAATAIERPDRLLAARHLFLRAASHENRDRHSPQFGHRPPSLRRDRAGLHTVAYVGAA
jgi:hypothetical protein